MFTRQWLIDAAERTATTFLEVFLAVEIAAGADAINMATIKGAGLAGFAAALAFVKSLLAQKVGHPDSASLAPSVGAPAVP